MSLPLCKFFNTRQGCRFGNKCRYKHSEPSFSSASLLPDNHHQDDCPVNTTEHPETLAGVPYKSRGESSEHNEASVNSTQHPVSALSQSASVREVPSQDEAAVNSPVQTTDSVQLPAYPDSTYSEHQDDSSVSADNQWKSLKRPCHYFTRYGNCRYGNRCHFEHVRSQRLPPQLQGQQNSTTTACSPDQAADASQDAPGSSPAKREGVRVSPKQDVDSSAEATRGPGHWDKAPCGGDEGGEAEDVTDHDYGDGKDSRNRRSGQDRSGRVCPFYLSGRCWRGQRCKFIHPKFGGSADQTANDDTAQQNQETIPNSREGQDQRKSGRATRNSDNQKAFPAKPQQRRPYIPQGVKKWKREEVDDVEAARLRRMEIDQLQKRFPRMQVKKDTSELFNCVVTFTPTDPDWPFDVKTFSLQVTIPADYPLEMLSVSLPTDQNLPETVRRYIEVSVEEWLEEKKEQLAEKNQVELVFRSFLRWLDRNIEDIVTDGLRQLKRELVAKSAGLEFISAKELQKQYPGGGDEDYSDDEEEDDGDDSEGDSENGHSSQTGDEEDYSETDSEYDEDGSEEYDEADETQRKAKQSRKEKQDKLKAMMAEPDRKGTEVSLKNMQLRESAASVYFEKIYLAIQCDRCKSTAEFPTSGGRANVVQCGKCGQTQVATFRPALVHQFSPTVGYLDLDACLPFDVILQNCTAIVNCLNCSKDTKIGAVLPGQAQDSWCRSCHKKMKLATDGVRFTQLGPSNATQELKGAVKVVIPRQRRVPKDPAIQEGKPLPNFGTCKHYKKSYRWLRFPCCGKCYPCDICHDSKEDHEMKLANRMICGFCCKEQMYAADRPCKGCDLNLTKVRTPHWEGGQGCRDKIAMCRNDKQKHRNMNKTVSKHSQKVKDMQSKKKTKLRHT